MLKNAWLIPLLPAISSVLILAFGKRLPGKGHEIGIGALAISFGMALLCAVKWIGMETHEGHREAVISHATWIKLAGVDIGAGIHIDGLAVMMLVVVTFISLLVHIYSMGYMHGDRRYTYFFAALSLFTASMLMLVVADNTLQLMIGWELVGLCSFMLIGHWWEEGVNSSAAIKAMHHDPLRRRRPHDRRDHPVLRRRSHVQHRAPQPRRPHRRDRPRPPARRAPPACSSA